MLKQIRKKGSVMGPITGLCLGVLVLGGCDTIDQMVSSGSLESGLESFNNWITESPEEAEAAISSAIDGAKSVGSGLANFLGFGDGGLGAGKEAYDGGDYITALNTLRPLAEDGNAEAQDYLGRMYYYGRGVTQNDQNAHVWFSVAIENGHEGSSGLVTATENRLSSAERTEAIRLAQQCLDSDYGDCPQ